MNGQCFCTSLARKTKSNWFHGGLEWKHLSNPVILFKKKKEIFYLKATTKLFHCHAYCRGFLKIHISWALGLFHVIWRKKKKSNSGWNTRLFACLMSVERCHGGLEPGSALFTEEHMVFHPQEHMVFHPQWAGRCFVIKCGKNLFFSQLSKERMYTVWNDQWEVLSHL